jgi:hypothetical protein
VRIDGGNGTCRLVDRQSGRVVVTSLVLATTFWQRLAGIVGPGRGARAVLELPSGTALLHEGQQFAVELSDGRHVESLDPRALRPSPGQL